MSVDSFKFLPRLLAAYYQAIAQASSDPIPWTPLERPLSECKFGLVTSGGLYLRERQQPFDLERERQHPSWGDPSFREIPTDVQQGDLAVSHLHLNTEDIQADFNILLPIHRFQELAAEGVIGGLASKVFSFMGYQGFPPDTKAWEQDYGPQVAEAFKSEGVHAVLLTPA
ncbi:MAG: hypothetical protein D6803_04765 [Anaerolineae bacterium]|nr:MAG: hypothetical protein D6803_04765 [Anaerolineae bacterium]